MGTIINNTTCNLCNCNDFKTLFKNCDRLHNFPGVFYIVKCKNCGLVYLNPKPNNIFQYYPTSYEPYNIDKKDFYQSLSYTLMRGYYKSNKKLFDKFKSFLYQKIYAPIPKEYIGKILDVGCGNGVYLHNLKNQGWDVYGIDPSQQSVNFAKNKLGLDNIIQGFLENGEYPNNFFDVITLNHVIEHLPDPHETIIKINKILKKNGMLIITTPNFDCVNERIFKQFWFPLETPRHIHIFTEDTLRKLLELNGLNIVKTKYDISSDHLAKSLSYRLGNSKCILFLLYRVKIFFMPFTFILSFLKKSDIMTVYAKK